MSATVDVHLLVLASIIFGMSLAVFGGRLIRGVRRVVAEREERRQQGDVAGHDPGEALHVRGNWYVLVVGLVGVVAVGVTFSGGFQEFGVGALSSFGAGAGKVALALGGFWAFDTWVMRDVDTREEVIERKNVAYAIVLLAIAVLFGLGLGSA